MKKLNSNLPQIEALNIASVMRSFLRKIIDAHKFFVKETPEYVAGLREIKWATKETYIPRRGSIYYWYYPLTLKEKLYYPIAYCKFMIFCIKDIVCG